MGRFDSLKSSNENDKDNNNPFRKGGRRKEKNEKTRDISKMTGTMALPGLNKKEENKSGKYVAPGLRNKQRSRNTTPIYKMVFKTEDKFREKAGDFPELGSNDFPDLNIGKQNEKILEETNKSDPQILKEEKPVSKWANIVTEKEKSEPETQSQLENTLGPVPAGWVRLRLDKKTRKTIIERGPPTGEYTKFAAHLEYRKKRQERIKLETRMREYEEYNRFMYPNDYYVNSWEWDDHVHHQEWLRKIAEDDGHFDTYPQYDSEEYYSDDY